MQSLYLEQHDAFIRWHEFGASCPVVVYLAGLSFPVMANLLPVAAHPALAGTRGVLIDYLGSGSSDHPADFSYSLEAHADCIASVLDHTGNGPVSVVGYSMGGSVGIMLALRRPDLVSRLVVGEGNVTPGGGAATRRIAEFAMADFLARGFPEMLVALRTAAIAGNASDAWVYGGWSQADPRGLHENSVALVNVPDDFADRFLESSIPRTFIYGEKNYPGGAGMVTPDTPDPEILRAHGVEIGIVQGVGHDLMRGNLKGFIDLLRPALALC